jgi:hypothetical protein
VARLNREIAAYLNTVDIQHRLYAFDLATEGAGTPQSAAQSIHADQKRWRALATELDIRPR